MANKEQILQKSQELFYKFSVRSITMDEIATQCGVSKKTIYQFFVDKDALVEAVLTHQIDDSQCHFFNARGLSKNAIHEVFLCLDMAQEMFAEMNPSLIFDLQKYHQQAFKKMEAHKQQFMHSRLKENFERGITEGLYRADIHVDVLVRLRIETIFIPFNQDVFPKNKFVIAVAEQAITEHFIYGLATIKGHKLIEKYKQERLKK